MGMDIYETQLFLKKDNIAAIFLYEMYGLDESLSLFFSILAARVIRCSG